MIFCFPRLPDQTGLAMHQPTGNKNGQMRDGSSILGRVDASRQDSEDHRPKGAGGAVIQQAARPLDRPVRPFGEHVDGRRSPSRRTSLDDPKDKVGAQVLIFTIFVFQKKQFIISYQSAKTLNKYFCFSLTLFTSRFKRHISFMTNIIHSSFIA